MFTQALGNELRAIRERLGLSRPQAVAKMEQLTGQTIGDQTLLTYEHGSRAMTVQRLMDLSITYGVPFIALIESALKRVEEAKPKCGLCGQQWPDNTRLNIR